MSTNDVPGMNPQNNDDLHAGCWAEHVDGTLIYVLGTENRRVLYELFELMDPKNPVEYRDAMKQNEFEKQFSWDPANPKSIKWTWHDKSAFPWDRVMKSFRQGVRAVSVKKQLDDAKRVRKTVKKHSVRAKSVAQVVARDRGLKPSPLRHADIQHRVEREMPKGGLASRIRSKIQGAIGRLKVGE
jgi:hypothetical protein